jgi:hypothetical protein
MEVEVEDLCVSRYPPAEGLAYSRARLPRGAYYTDLSWKKVIRRPLPRHAEAGEVSLPVYEAETSQH